MIFSPVTNANQAAYLALVIEEHHNEFRALYPNCSIIPKMHYLIHYPRTMTRYSRIDSFMFSQILSNAKFVCTINSFSSHILCFVPFRLGPMMTHWCMRFEAKHRYFKQLATAIGNYTNLPWTLAERHQSRQSHALYNVHKLIECGPGNGIYNLFSLQHMNEYQQYWLHIIMCVMAHKPCLVVFLIAT